MTVARRHGSVGCQVARARSPPGETSRSPPGRGSQFRATGPAAARRAFSAGAIVLPPIPIVPLAVRIAPLAVRVVPPAGTIVPPADTIVPPADTIVPPADTVVPPADTIVPPAETVVVPAASSTGGSVPRSGSGWELRQTLSRSRPKLVPVGAPSFIRQRN